MLNQLRLLVFDLDYVLFNCAALKLRALRDTLISFADEIPHDVRFPDAVDIEESFRDFGRHWVRRLEIGLDEERTALLETAYQVQEPRRVAEGIGNLYPGLQPVLSACRAGGAALAIGAEANRDYLLAVSDFHNLDSFFEGIYCTEEFGMGGADEMLEEVLGRGEVNPSEALAFGTRPDFFQAAHGLDILTVGCSWGLQNPGDLSGADLQCNTIDNLEAILQRADIRAARY